MTKPATTHTPGPWLIYDGRHCGERLLITSASGVVLAECHYILPMQANASLIAEAPIMLDALKACLLREDIANDELGDLIQSVIDKAEPPSPKPPANLKNERNGYACPKRI